MPATICELNQSMRKEYTRVGTRCFVQSVVFLFSFK